MLPGLVISVARHPSKVEDWLDVAVEVTAPPFTGTVSSIIERAALANWKDAFAQLTVPGAVVLGGGRGLRIDLQVRRQTGGTPGSLTIEAAVTPSGDDPYPELRYLIFDAPDDFATVSGAALESVLGPS